MRQRTEQEERTIAEIEIACGAPLGGKEKQYIEKENYLGNCQLGFITPQQVANDIDDVFASDRAKSLSRKTQDISSTTYEPNLTSVNSQLMALDASNKSEVINFRKYVLKYRLIPIDKVDNWIKKTAKKDGFPTLWLDGVELPKDAKRTVKDGVVLIDKIAITQATNIKGYELKFWMPEVDKVNSVYVTRGGILDNLRVLSGKLAQGYGWTQAQAATFVLTTHLPLVEAIEVGVQVHSENNLANKLVLAIDPTSTVQEVADAYAWGKKEFFEVSNKHNSTKSHQLALFYAQYCEFSKDKLNRHNLLQEWNKLCDVETWRSDRQVSDWKYDPKTGINNFQRDLKDAYKKDFEGRSIRRGNL